ncbi:hypothetical protein BCT56_25870 [Vibrio lentus]|uniref:Uncharacterized protein n=1 Tax=Vibrio lentus TaxID=136468 RepID=A0AB36XJ28_9VIBR|nr:hypothetical protein BCU51_26320 [Vibrio lentus]PMK31288.1 hypothetical protein BCU02_25530 [Vibrio lentus]PMK43683.1 hypothetical protein BCT99_25505 [Vibrio lentus]PML31672.1 hypothetical protein BCT79_18530 [Vibrio lentus]PMM39364.1 hypothetical protein BCT56_25870 [Vibrio lentus]
MSISSDRDPELNLIIDFGNLLILFPSSPLIIKPSSMKLTLHCRTGSLEMWGFLILGEVF